MEEDNEESVGRLRRMEEGRKQVRVIEEGRRKKMR